MEWEIAGSSPVKYPWEVGRVVYCTCLENRRGLKASEGSNPSLPAWAYSDSGSTLDLHSRSSGSIPLWSTGILRQEKYDRR